MAPYGDIDQSQHWLMYWLVALTRTNDDHSSISSGLHLMAIVTGDAYQNLKSGPYLSMDNGLIGLLPPKYMIDNTDHQNTPFGPTL